MRARFEILLALILSQGVPLLAQSSHPIVPGTRVRVHTGAAVPLTGRLVAASDSQVTIQAGAERIVVATADIRELEVGKVRSGAGKGAKVGALVGGLIGFAAGVALMSENDGFFDYGPEVIPAGALSGGLMGGGVGLVIGALNTREEWTALPDPTVTLAPAPSVTGVGLGIRF